jgi:uncharacterized protein YfdQ (DUF2303 family)
MTDTTYTYKAPRGDEEAVIEVARLAERRGAPVEVDPETLYVVRADDGRVEVLDLAGHRARPERKTGVVGFYTAGAFGEYVARHSVPGDDTEATIWGDARSRTVWAVLDDHSRDLTGWGEHRALLQLRTTTAWDAWIANDGKWLDQVVFAEQVEDRLIDIVEPDAAFMLELAQSFQATSSANFRADQRLASGEVKLRYEETVTAGAGPAGEMNIPTAFVVGIAPFEGADAFQVTARFRYRIREGNLKLSYKLERPEDVLQTAFDEVLEQIATATGVTTWNGTPRPA